MSQHLLKERLVILQVYLLFSNRYFLLRLRFSISPSIIFSITIESFSLNEIISQISAQLKTHLSGAIEISRTARNSPQLLRCSFSSRKKFHTKRRNTSNMAKMVDIIALSIFVVYNRVVRRYFENVLNAGLFILYFTFAIQAKRRTLSSIIARKYM